MLKGNTIKLGLMAIALVTSGCQITNTGTSTSTYDLYHSYRLEPNNKAYAIGTNKVAGASWGASTPEEAMKLANEVCIELGGINCIVIDVNGSSIAY